MTADLWLCPDFLFDGTDLLTHRALGVRGMRSLQVMNVQDLPPDAWRVPLSGTLSAGFLDLQVNGGGDVLLNNNPTSAGMATIAAAHRRFGTVGILPTVITDAPDVLESAVAAALASQGAPGILGIHIEGPHLNQSRRGTHLAAYVRPFEPATLGHVERLCAAGVFVMITLAPEAVAPGQINALVRAGAVVSLGHSDADADSVRAAMDEGATCFTHLYNAMSPMLNRAPGMTGACINSAAYAGIICDGHHVADEMIALAIRARPVAGKMFLVSDAMSTVGGSDRFTLYGQEIRLVGGRLVNDEGSLAGAHVTMAQSLQRLITRVGVGAQTALAMAVSTPAALLGRPELGSPAARDLADLVLLGNEWSLAAMGADLLRGQAA